MKRIIWAPLAVSLAMTVGCGGGDTAGETAASGAANPSRANTVAAAPATSASAQVVATPSESNSAAIPTDPQEIVRVFMDAMRAGDGERLEGLFSSAALAEIQRQGFKIQPPGTSQAKFQVQSASMQNDSMIVSSTWTEPSSVEGEPAEEMDVLWELRMERGGWRICAMAADPGTGDELEVVNFENLEEPGKWLESQAGTRVASAPGGPGAAELPASTPATNGASLPPLNPSPATN